MSHPPTWAARPRFVALALLLATWAHGVAGCDDDSAADCQTTYRHLLTVAHKNHTPEAMATFMTACTEHYDPRRLECLREASTPGAALACKPFKKRPD
ncbi:MAG TPA: hypothetical protein PK095_23015 [Myxococcota bacterium]|nr:hypothetical protein [Myxococcota bacterium]